MSVVLLTRPEGENEGLAAQLRSAGENVLTRPLIRLSATEPDHALRQTAMDLDQQDIIIFISKSAVRIGMPLLDQYWPQWPVGLTWLAVGSGTADLLKDWQINAGFPSKAGSEGLLALPELNQVTDQKVLIVRGQGGRELLSQTLTDRGATVTYWEVYRRDVIALSDIESLTPGSLVVATSGEIVDALVSQLGERTAELVLVTVSDRIAERASDRFSSIKIAAGASEQALYETIRACR